MALSLFHVMLPFPLDTTKAKHGRVTYILSNSIVAISIRNSGCFVLGMVPDPVLGA